MNAAGALANGPPQLQDLLEENRALARSLDEVARLLEAQKDNPSPPWRTSSAGCATGW
ncbi:MAG: hypothetical protein HY717_12540 [Planctomycetes bacterium]|nr:hypothetical protein [Planctomycetota bacterium]